MQSFVGRRYKSKTSRSNFISKQNVIFFPSAIKGENGVVNLKKIVHPSFVTALRAESKQFFKPQLCMAMNDVKIHHDKEAVILAERFNARAFTYNNHVFFNKNEYQPHTKEGKKLLAHELSHVQQFNRGSVFNMVLRKEKSPGITSALPKDAATDEKTGEAKFAVNKINFVAEPDMKLKEEKTTWRNQTIEPSKNGASTNFALSYSINYTQAGKRYTSVTVSYTVYIKTFYGKNADQKGDSAYGRGTTADDIKAGNKSLQFHESQHGQDFQDYIAANPLPVFNIALPATETAYGKAMESFKADVIAYQKAMQQYSEAHTDETGKKKSEIK